MKLLHTITMLILIVVVAVAFAINVKQLKRILEKSSGNSLEAVAKIEIKMLGVLVIAILCIAVPILVMPANPYDIISFSNARTDVSGYSLQYNKDGSLKHHSDGSLDIDYDYTTTVDNTYAKNWATVFSMPSKFINYFAFPLAVAGLSIYIFLCCRFKILKMIDAEGDNVEIKGRKNIVFIPIAVAAISIIVLWQSMPFLSEIIGYKEMRQEWGLDGINYIQAINNGHYDAAILLGAAKESVARDAGEGRAMRSFASILSNGSAKIDRFNIYFSALTDDGRVNSSGKIIGNDEWSDIIAFDVNDSYHDWVGLRSDGTVITAHYEYSFRDDCEINILDWEDIVDVKIASFTYGLKSDGTVVCDANAYYDKETAKWKDIVSLWKADDVIIGVNSHGDVFASERGVNDLFSGWHNIEEIYYEDSYYFGKQTTGNWLVCDVGHNILSPDSEKENIEAVESWQNIISFAVHDFGNKNRRVIFGLKDNGTVIAVGSENATKVISNWNNIIAIYADDHQNIWGLKANGKIVSAFFTLEK